MKHAALKLAASAAALGIMGMAANAADLPPPVVIEPPVTHYPEVLPKKMTGWYIRGDISYDWNHFRGAHYITYGDPDGGTGHLDGKLKDSWNIGGGIGYQINHNFRTDLTVDYMFKSGFHGSTTGICTTDPGGLDAECVSTDVSGYDAWTVLANAYVDLGTYAHVTPYVGAGIGGSYVRWHDLENTIPDGFDQTGTIVHDGVASWRFAYALMAGVSIEATKKLSVDLGYRYKKIHGGRMFQFAADAQGFGAGPGFDKGIETHEVRAGLRYKIGGGDHYKKAHYEPPVYDPPTYDPPMVYK